MPAIPQSSAGLEVEDGSFSGLHYIAASDYHPSLPNLFPTGRGKCQVIVV